jgi:CRP-like cAMP-binding protein
VITAGEPADKLYVVKSGAVNITKSDQVLRTVEQFDYFGERGLLTNEVRSASGVAVEDGTQCWTITAEQFSAIAESTVLEQLRQRMELSDDTVQLSNLQVIKQLGTGMFGSVYLCLHKYKSIYYALKAIPRIKVDKYQIHVNT